MENNGLVIFISIDMFFGTQKVLNTRQYKEGYIEVTIENNPFPYILTQETFDRTTSKKPEKNLELVLNNLYEDLISKLMKAMAEEGFVYEHGTYGFLMRKLGSSLLENRKRYQEHEHKVNIADLEKEAKELKLKTEEDFKNSPVVKRLDELSSEPLNMLLLFEKAKDF